MGCHYVSMSNEANIMRLNRVNVDVVWKNILKQNKRIKERWKGKKEKMK